MEHADLARRARARANLTHERLKGLLSYDPDAGSFRWLTDRSRTAKAGELAGHVSPNGKTAYVRICIDGRLYMAHVLAWLYMTGEFPPFRLDHEDGNGLNNMWRNIRPCTQSQNCANRRRSENNTSGFKGVTWRRRERKWLAQIGNARRRRWIGLFDTAEEAHAAYMAEAQNLFGQFARAA